MRPLLVKMLAAGVALAMLGLQAVSEGYAVKHRQADPAGFVLTSGALVCIVLILMICLSRPYFRQWGIPLPFSPASLAPDNYKADSEDNEADGLAHKATVLEN